jgi:hypothetical protein
MNEFFSKMWPTRALFTMLEDIALRCLPSCGFPIDTKHVLATLTAYVAFEDVWSDHDIDAYVVHPKSSLFMTMNGICHKQPKPLFPEAMEFVRSKMRWWVDTRDFYSSIFVRRIYEMAKEETIGDGDGIEVQDEVAAGFLQFEVEATNDVILED